MGSEDMTTKKQACQHCGIKHNLKILLLIVLTNLLTIYIFLGPHSHFLYPISRFPQISGPPSFDSTPLSIDLNSTRDQLIASRFEIAALQRELVLSRSLVKELNGNIDQASKSSPIGYDDLLDDVSSEAKLSIGPHKLPLGYTQRMGSDEIYFSMGGTCLKHKQDLEKYMSYAVGGECPADDVLAQALMMKGCEPLPTRRCHPKSPHNYVEPTPLPASLWTMPPDTSIVWDAYDCKNYMCLKERKNEQRSYDCKDCFDLEGRESHRWMSDHGSLDFGIDQVLATRTPGSIRIGLDIGGGSGTFAARMKEKGITIVTTSMNFDGPFNSFIASRGLISMHITVSQRLPFFENTLDIIHSMHVLSNWIPDTMLEFILYDIYRALRPGGLFWLDRFFCYGSQLNSTYVPLFDRVGFRKLRWNAGRKLDRGVKKNEWYFSALLEKPMT